MSYHIVLVSPDRGTVYDGRTPDERGVGGGITGRVSLLAALARLGHRVQAYVNCAEQTIIDGVEYIPLDALQAIDCDLFIASTTGGELTFAPLAGIPITAQLRLLWIMGSPRPAEIEIVQPDFYLVISNFLRDVAVQRWGVPSEKVFVVHLGLHQDQFAAVEANPPARDPYALVYTGHPSKGLDAAIEVLRRLRAEDKRFHLDVYGGNALWGSSPTEISEPGVTFRGLIGQRDLIPRLFHYGFCIALQSMEEGFGIAVQEAKRAGIIVLANAGSSFKEVIQNGVDGFLFYEPHDSPVCHDRAAKLIQSLVTDDAAMERIRRAAVQTPWDWNTVAQTWIAFYEHQLGVAPAPTENYDAIELVRFADGLHDLTSGRYYPITPTPKIGMSEAPPILTKTVLVAGYYGFGNTGDEAILTAILEGLSDDIRPIVVSGDPHATSGTYGVEAVRWNDIAALIDAAERADAIILGGGGLFQDYWGVPSETVLMPEHRGMAFFAAFPLLAALLDKPLLIHGVGVGPLTTDEGKRLTKMAFDQAVRASVRDAESRDLVLGLGIDPARIEQTVDLAFALHPDLSDMTADLFRSIRMTESTPFLLGVALRPWDVDIDPAVWMQSVAAALDQFLDEHDAEIIFIPFQTLQATEGILTDDQHVAQTVLDQMRHGDRARLINIPPSPATMLHALGSCDLILGMRLHAVLLASVLGVPSVGIVYDPKVTQAMVELGIGEYACDLASLDAEILAERLDSAFNRHADLRRTLNANAETAAQTARRDLERLVGWIEQLTPEMQTVSVDLSPNTLFRGVLTRYLRRSGELLLDEHTTLQRALALVQTADRELLTLIEQSVSARAAAQTAHAHAVELENRVRSIEADADIHDHERQAELATLKIEVDELRTNIAALMIQKDTLLAHIEQIESDYAYLAHEQSALTADNAALSSELSALQTQFQMTERHLRESNAYIEHLRRDIASSPFVGVLKFLRTLVSNPPQAGKMAARTLYHLAIPLRMRLALRSMRQQSAELSAFLRNPPVFLARKTYHIVMPLRVRLALKQMRTERQMNWYAYAFERYKRARMATYGESLEGIRVPSEAGLVTVVLPAYNGADMIGEAIETVLAQTYPHFELIIINDGSTDETGAIADDYARRDARIRVVHQENRKIPRTLSRGFQMARGEFLTWTSCDNRMKPEFLQQMAASLQRHPSWDMVYANMDIIGEDGAYLQNSSWYSGYQRPPGSEHVYLPDAPDELNVWANNYIGAAFMYRSRIAYLLGDYSRYRFTTEDYDYWMRVNEIGTLRHTDFDTPIYDYRFHEKSLTSKDKELGITRSRERLMVFDDFRRDFLLSPLIWQIDAHDGGAQHLAMHVQLMGHLLKTDDYTFDQLPPAWTPVIYVCAVSDTTSIPEPRADLPDSAYKALVVMNAEGELPASISAAWDCAVVVSLNPIPVPRLETPHQGWMNARDIFALFQLLDIRAKSHHLAHLESLIEQPRPSEYHASIVICTHRFNERLVNAIRSTAHQTIIRDDQYEVIVVNNNTAHDGLNAAIDSIREQDFGGDPDRLRLITCPIPGLSAARNAGIAAAKGEVVCFIDDDAVAEPDWLEHILRAYESHPDVGVVGGYIMLTVPNQRPPALAPGLEKYWSHFVGNHDGYTTARYWYEYPWGANWTARREALLRAGGFRTRYGRKGDDFGGGEEIAAAALIARLGYEIGVQPAARVKHDVDPKRYTIEHLRRTLRAGHLSQYSLQRDLYIPMESGIRATLYMLRRYNFDPILNRRKPIAWIDMLMRKSAQLTLLRTQLRDLRARYRRPAVREGE